MLVKQLHKLSGTMFQCMQLDQRRLIRRTVPSIELILRMVDGLHSEPGQLVVETKLSLLYKSKEQALRLTRSSLICPEGRYDEAMGHKSPIHDYRG